MFFSVIAACLVATAFAFCGVVNTVGYIMECEQGMGAFLFIEGLAVAMWPLAVAAALLMLVRIGSLTERWMLLWTIAQAPARADKSPAPRSARPAAPRPAADDKAETQETRAIPLPPTPQPREAAPAPQEAPRDGSLNFFKLD